MNDRFLLIVIDRQKKVFEGEVRSVSGSNKTGPFDILPLHENFITIVSGNLRIKKADGLMENIAVTNGVLKARENKVEVFIGVKK